MGLFLDTAVTECETFTLVKVIENLIECGNPEPSTDDILHELIRLSSIAIKHLKY